MVWIGSMLYDWLSTNGRVRHKFLDCPRSCYLSIVSTFPKESQLLCKKLQLDPFLNGVNSPTRLCGLCFFEVSGFCES